MAMFKAFKPAAMNKIAQAMGYQGDMNQFQQFIEGDPARQQQMNMYTNAAKQMAKGGMVKKFAVGGTTTNPSGTQAATPTVTQPTQAPAGTPGVTQYSVEQMYTPRCTCRWYYNRCRNSADSTTRHCCWYRCYYWSSCCTNSYGCYSTSSTYSTNTS